jgi:glutamine synthetase
MTAAVDFDAWLQGHGVEHVHAGGVDHLGTWRGKRLTRRTAVESLDGHGVAFSDVFWALTIAEDWIIPPAEHAGYFPVKETGYPDIFLRLEPETAIVAPWLGGEAWVLGSWYLPDGRPVPLDPRARLRALVAELADRGHRLRAGFEFEFYLFDEPLAELAARGFDAPRTAHTHAYTYHGQRAAQDREVLDSLIVPLAASGLVIESANCETGQGQYEVNVRYDDALAAADQAHLFKQATKAIAAAQGRTASFMAKPLADRAGSSCHVHLSLWTPDGGQNSFASGPEGALNEVAAPCLAGLLATLPAATALCCPTVNAYKRLAPYSWAATTVSWALENRTVALRAIEAEEGITRIEHRLPGADANPYLALGAMAAGLLEGLDGGLVPPAPTTGDAYVDETLALLPATLDEAIAALAADTRLRARLGDDLVAHLLVCLREESGYHRASVSDWERRRYLELA